ncbi:mitochondrial import inner membrane translocase subunit TIM16 [Kickxella alabastrina]|uniref:Mitochondrial import inner membrane translocase subunit TIM16 n=1 Tax=Kickxella alabastrina TaxID=61397 RepID=A0ACC1IF34_9FUNG|nr:mitochondrial import inner membrane translocase subunit TIM16 [Kickxella alabastrina]
MSAPKAIIQMLMTGTRIIGRAFGDAYKQAGANSTAARAAAGNMKESADGDRMTQASGITVDESTKILNIQDPNNKEDMVKKFEHLFASNDPKKGGSFYLQSKIIRARERIEMHWAQEKLKAQQEAAGEVPAESIAPDGTKPDGPPSDSNSKPQ